MKLNNRSTVGVKLWRTLQSEELLLVWVFALFVASIFVYALRPLWAYALFATSAALVFATTFNDTYAVFQKHRWLIAAYFVALIVALPASVHRSSTAILHFGMATLTIATALSLTTRPRIWLRAALLALISFQSAVVIFLIQVGLSDFPLERLFPGASSNVVTSSLLVLQVNYLAALYVVKRRVASLTPVVTLLLCAVGYGRASMLTAFLIMILVIIYPLPMIKRGWPSIRRLALISVTVLVAAYSFGGIRGIADTVAVAAPGIADTVAVAAPSTKLASGLRDDARETMIREYASALTIPTLVFGQPYDGMDIKNRYNGNPHNSYIRAHHIFGILYGLSVASIAVFGMMRGALPIQVRIFISFLLLTILFRGFFETLVFPTAYDIIFFTLCIVSLNGPPSTKRRDRICQDYPDVNTQIRL